MERFAIVNVGRKTAKSEKKLAYFHVWKPRPVSFCITTLSIPQRLRLLSAFGGRVIRRVADQAGRDCCSTCVHRVTSSHLTPPTNGTIGTDVFARPTANCKKDYRRKNEDCSTRLNASSSSPPTRFLLSKRLGRRSGATRF